MIVPVTIVVDGAVVSSSLPARIVAGRVIAPLRPIVVRLTSRAAYEPAAAAVDVERGATRLRLPVRLVQDGEPYVEVAPLVRAIGGSVSFDAPTKTLVIITPPDATIATPVPYDPAAPQASPNAIFTPAPPRATPRVPDTGAPRPRRTAIPARPSQPQPPPDQAARMPATTPRRSEF